MAKKLYADGMAKGVPGSVAARSSFVFDALISANSLSDLAALKSLRLKKVRGRKPTRFMAYVADGWWISFRWEDESCVDIEVVEPVS
jgi:plasmid maintenance system killer protein